MSILQKIKHTIVGKAAKSAESEIEPVEKIGRSLTQNMRALRLTMRIAEELLSYGVSAHDVVETASAITGTYCARKVFFDVNATSIMASQDRGLDKEPLTLIRTVELRYSNNTIVQDMQELARDIKKGLPLETAEARFARSTEHPKTYPWWLVMLGNAGVSAGVILLFTHSWVIFLTTFFIGCLVDRLLWLMDHRGMPEFFSQAVAAVFITLTAVLVATLGELGMRPFIGVSPTLIVVGGVVMLVAGLTLTATAQDAIDEFYVTAGARFMRTLMMTAGIVIGIVVGIGIARGLGSDVVVSSDPIPLGDPVFQIVGAVLLSAAWALYTQSSRAAIFWAGLIGGVAWVVYMVTASMGEATANGIAAIAVGFFGAIIARLTKSPSIAIIESAILPLVPGLALYNGLMQFTEPSKDHISQGASLLLTAIMVALAIAAGASFGNYLGRPVRNQLVRIRRHIERLPTQPK